MAITRLNNNSITSITALPSAVAVDNEPMFFIRATGSALSVSADTNTKLTVWDTPEIDTDSGWSSTNSRWTVPTGKGGKYFIHCAVKYAGTADRRLRGHIYVNGSVSRVLASNITYYAGLEISSFVNLSAGDYVEIFGRLDNGGGGSLGTDPNEQWLGIHRLIS